MLQDLFTSIQHEQESLTGVEEIIEVINLTIQTYGQCQKSFQQISAIPSKTKDESLLLILTCLKEDAKSKGQQLEELNTNLQSEILVQLITLQNTHKDEVSQISHSDFVAFQKRALNKLKQFEDEMVNFSHSYWKAKKDFIQADLLYKEGITDQTITPSLKQQLFQNMTQKMKYSKQNEKAYRDFVEKANDQQRQLLTEMKCQLDKLVKRDQERLEIGVESVKKYLLYEQFHDASKKFNLGILQNDINSFDIQSEMSKKFDQQILEWKAESVSKFMFVEYAGFDNKGDQNNEQISRDRSIGNNDKKQESETKLQEEQSQELEEEFKEEPQ